MATYQNSPVGMRPMRRNLATARDTSEMLAIPLSSLYDHARAGRLPGVVRVGRRVLFDLDKLTEWVDRGGESVSRTAGAN